MRYVATVIFHTDAGRLHRYRGGYVPHPVQTGENVSYIARGVEIDEAAGVHDDRVHAIPAVRHRLDRSSDSLKDILPSIVLPSLSVK